MKYLVYISILLVMMGVGLLCLGVLQTGYASTPDEVRVLRSEESTDQVSLPIALNSNEGIPLLLPQESQKADPASQEKPQQKQDMPEGVPGQKINLQKIDGNLKVGRNIPDRIVIPTIGLDAPVESASLTVVTVSGYKFSQWAAPEHYAAGWHLDSAALGENGNTVINGHHNDFGEVFKRLVDLKAGDIIYLFSKQNIYPYLINNIILLQEKGVTLRQRMENAKWMAPTKDERVTLITCWPYESNSHRLILIASPIR